MLQVPGEHTECPGQGRPRGRVGDGGALGESPLDIQGSVDGTALGPAGMAGLPSSRCVTCMSVRGSVAPGHGTTGANHPETGPETSVRQQWKELRSLLDEETTRGK